MHMHKMNVPRILLARRSPSGCICLLPVTVHAKRDLKTAQLEQAAHTESKWRPVGCLRAHLDAISEISLEIYGYTMPLNAR